MSDLEPDDLLPASERPTRVRYLVLGLACALAVVTYLHRVGFSSVSTEMLADLHMGTRELGYMTAAFMVAYGLFEVPWGHLGDRFGVRGILAVIVLGGSLLTAGVALVVFLPNVYRWQLVFLLLLRFLFGAFQAGTFPALSRMLADWMPTTERGTAQGLVWMSTRAGGVLAPFLLVPLFQRLGNWRIPLAIVAGLGLLWCAAFWPWFRGKPESMRQVNAGELERIIAGRGSRKGSSGHGIPWRRMLGSENVWSLALMYGFLGYSGNFFVTMLANYLEAHRHLDKETAKWLSAVPFATGVVGCVAGGFLSDAIIRRWGNRKWGRRLVGSAGMALASASILATIGVHEVPALAALLGLTFFGNDLAMGPAWAAAADIGERHAGTLGGAMNMLASLGGAVGGLVTGHFLHSDHPKLPFLIFACSYALGAICWLRVDVTRPLADGEWRVTDE